MFVVKVEATPGVAHSPPWRLRNALCRWRLPSGQRRHGGHRRG